MKLDILHHRSFKMIFVTYTGAVKNDNLYNYVNGNMNIL